MTYAIAAAGTGGHVFPGLAVGEALVDAGVSRRDVLYVGGSRLERAVFPEAGFPFLEVELAGLQRRLTPANLRIPAVVAAAVRDIAAEYRRRSVRAVLGLGGYVTVPAGLAARGVGARLAVSDQNAHAGLANRIISRLAAARFGAFPETIGMPGARWVGNPVRASVLRPVDRAEALAHYGIEDGRRVVGVFGGSLGAGALNAAVERAVDGWIDAGITVLHLAGMRNPDVVDRAARRDHWIAMGFEDRMERFYAASDLVVARSGGSVAELTATHTPSVLVPGSFGSGGHQRANAAVLAEAGASVVVEEASIDRLGEVVMGIVSDDDRLEAMVAGCARLAKPAAATTIATEMRTLHG